MQDEELYATALEIRILTKTLASIATRSLEQHLQEHGAPISALQHGVMRMLCHHQHTSSELSRRMNLDPATLVPVIDALERNGYVKRGKDPNDRRRSPLLLTEAGADLLARVPLYNRSDALACALAKLGAEPTCELLRLLRELLGHMAPDRELANHLASLAQTARDMFRAQAAAGDSAPQYGDAIDQTATG
ncbi:MAG TPA: MarR family transcriptional regulator [Roseiflexaceae bacterium]|nr:MarR family transcriptional regulator [Roseiflexaceae bacterium]